MKTPAPPGYNLQDLHIFPFMTASAGARDLDISIQRFSRILQKTKTPVFKLGYTLLFPKKDLQYLKNQLRLTRKSGINHAD